MDIDEDSRLPVCWQLEALQSPGNEYRLWSLGGIIYKIRL